MTWDSFVWALTWRVPAKNVSRDLRPFINAARAMRGGDGGRPLTKWWTSVPVYDDLAPVSGEFEAR